MSAPWTPGPWSHSPSSGTPGHGLVAQVWDADGVALLFFADGRGIGPEADATARLIAEVPAMAELVDRLATLLRDACGRDNLMTDEDAEAITEARALLARGKGEW